MRKRLLWSLQLVVAIVLLLVASRVYAAEPIYQANSLQELEDIIYTSIENRENQFKIEYHGNVDNIMSEIKICRENAVSRDPYQEGCIALISGFTVSKFDDTADIAFTGFQYYTTRGQEDYVDSEINRIIATITSPSMDEEQIEKTIHNYIINNVEYDTSLEGYTAYSALYNGETVCNGYVQLAYRLFKQAGLETQIVKGTLNNGGTQKDHVWNLVKVNGNWYHLDVTLNDSLSSASVIDYTYYNLTDDQIKKEHSFDADQYPSASVGYQLEGDGSESSSSYQGSLSSPKSLVEESVTEGVVKAVVNKELFLERLTNLDSQSWIVDINITKAGDSVELIIPKEVIKEGLDKSDHLILQINSQLGSTALTVAGLDQGTDVLIIQSCLTKDEADKAQAPAIKINAKLISEPLKVEVNKLNSDGSREPIEDTGYYLESSVNIDDVLNRGPLTGVLYNPVTKQYLPVPMVVDWEVKQATFKHLGNGILLGINYNKSFVDMEKHWAKKDVELLASKLVIQGKTSDSFDPSGKVTRAEFATLLVRALGLTGIDKDTSEFNDVEDQWYADSVAIASKAGLVQGYSDGTFKPQATISRQEMAVMIARALEYIGVEHEQVEEDVLLEGFTDNALIKDWAKDAVSTSAQAGIVQGDQRGSFNPNEQATRAEAAVVLIRTLVHVGFAE